MGCKRRGERHKRRFGVFHSTSCQHTTEAQTLGKIPVTGRLRSPAAFILLSFKASGANVGGNGTSGDLRVHGEMLRASHRPSPATTASPKSQRASHGDATKEFKPEQ